jgi:hypothetical protein
MAAKKFTPHIQVVPIIIAVEGQIESEAWREQLII